MVIFIRTDRRAFVKELVLPAARSRCGVFKVGQCSLI